MLDSALESSLAAVALADDWLRRAV
jgi:hypothetical protein